MLKELGSWIKANVLVKPEKLMPGEALVYPHKGTFAKVIRKGEEMMPIRYRNAHEFLFNRYLDVSSIESTTGVDPDSLKWYAAFRCDNSVSFCAKPPPSGDTKVLVEYQPALHGVYGFSGRGRKRHDVFLRELKKFRESIVDGQTLIKLVESLRSIQKSETQNLDPNRIVVKTSGLGVAGTAEVRIPERIKFEFSPIYDMHSGGKIGMTCLLNVSVVDGEIFFELEPEKTQDELLIDICTYVESVSGWDVSPGSEMYFKRELRDPDEIF